MMLLNGSMEGEGTLTMSTTPAVRPLRDSTAARAALMSRSTCRAGPISVALECADGLGQRRLSEVEVRGRTAESRVVDDGQEVLQLADVHDVPPQRCPATGLGSALRTTFGADREHLVEPAHLRRRSVLFGDCRGDGGCDAGVEHAGHDVIRV